MLQGNVFEAELEMAAGANTVTVQATDASGNVTTRSYQVDVPAAGTSYGYDSNGNLTQKTEGSDTWTYSWNAENQLTKVEKNSVEQARFSYDPKGRRVEKVGAGVATAFAYSREDILRETKGGAATKYIHGPGIDEPLASEDGSGSLSYLHADGLGSVVKTTEAAGVVTLTRQYDAWGNVQAGVEEPGFAFTGREWMPEIRLYYYRARYYAPEGARFVSEDPVGHHDSVNLYLYVRNTPTIRVDPTGLESMNTTEMEYCVFHPMNCALAGDCMAAAGWLDTGGNSNPGNAFKHCWWSCCITKLVGRDAAFEITNNHEANERHTAPCASQMDRANNRAGIVFAVADPKRECSDMCGNARLQCYPKAPPCWQPGPMRNF